MRSRTKAGHAQGKRAKIPTGARRELALGELFSESVAMAGGSAVAISRLLTEHGIVHYFLGGLVVGCHSGRPRSTQDVDLLIAVTLPKATARALSKLLDASRIERHPSFTSFLRRSAVGEREVLDVIHADAGSYRLVPGNHLVIESNGATYRIPTPEMMVVLKYTAAINPIRTRAKQLQDLADLYAIVDAQPRLDLARVAQLADAVLPGFGDDLHRRIQLHRHPLLSDSDVPHIRAPRPRAKP